MAWIIKRPSGSYQVCWREPDGKQRYKTYRKFEYARAFKTEIEGLLSRNAYVSIDAQKQPLGEYMTLMLNAGDLRDSTRANYEYRRTHTAELERRAIGSITKQDILKLLGNMEQAGIGAPTRRYVLKLLSKAFNAAVADGILVRNPVKFIPNPRSERREIHVYTPQEIMALADTITPSLKGAVLLSAYGGLRGGEVCGLRVQDVDFLRGAVSVVQAVRLVRGRAVLGPPKTKASRRTVNVPRFVIEALNVEAGARSVVLGDSASSAEGGVAGGVEPVTPTLPGAVPPASTANVEGALADTRVLQSGEVRPAETGNPAPEPSSPSTLLFPAAHGGLNSSKSLGTAFRAALKKTGLTGTWHMLRHTSVALAIQQGAHPKTIQSRLGHTSITTTLDVYGHLFEGTDQDLAQKMQQYGEVQEADVIGWRRV